MWAVRAVGKGQFSWRTVGRGRVRCEEALEGFLPANEHCRGIFGCSVDPILA